jgi:DHA1 family inner membrane transport protein
VMLRTPWPVEFTLFVLLGFAFYSLHGCIQVYVTELAPGARGTALALHSSFFFTGQAIGPIVYGVGLSHGGLSPTLMTAAVVVMLIGLACARFLRHRATPA